MASSERSRGRGVISWSDSRVVKRKSRAVNSTNVSAEKDVVVSDDNRSGIGDPRLTDSGPVVEV